MAGSLSVLMAEDDEGHATLLRRSLKRAGLGSDPVHLRDGQELLDYVYQRGPWLDRTPHESVAMILDLNMPRLGGTEVLARLKRDEDLARIPVFVLTTTDNPLELDRCYALGAAACLVKPVDYGAFGDMIRRLAEFLMTARLPGELPLSQARE
ncbi:MAG TPA: response regulator [Vicinamibacterales bacterium]|nr:response regulator [Vicinamibacterales bacterium]